MTLLNEKQIDCPNCGEVITIVIDTSITEQQYTEDCFVCCSPIIITIDQDNQFNQISWTNETDLYS